MSGLGIIRLTTQGTGIVSLGTAISLGTQSPLTMTSPEVERLTNGTFKATYNQCATTTTTTRAAEPSPNTKPSRKD